MNPTEMSKTTFSGNTKRIFLASPYTHENEEVINVRYKAALEATGNLLSEGYIIFSPVIHCHLPAKIYNLPKDYKFWAVYNDSFLYYWAEVLYVLCLKDWENSAGVTREVNIAEDLNLPIYYRTLH